MQTVVAISNVEAEDVAMSKAVRDSLALRSRRRQPYSSRITLV